jgi:hypothetical protein
VAIVPTVSLLPNCRRLADRPETAFGEASADYALHAGSRSLGDGRWNSSLLRSAAPCEHGLIGAGFPAAIIDLRRNLFFRAQLRCTATSARPYHPSLSRSLPAILR